MNNKTGREGIPQFINGLRRQLSWKNTFSAFKYRNYRLWFWGQTVSLVGSWMQATAQGFFIFELTRSPAFLGYTGFAMGIPTWLFMLYGGVIADRMKRRTLLLITQTAMMALAFTLAALTFSGLVKPWHVVILAFGLGVANAFDAPARHAFVSEMVEREDMSNAIALNSTMFNLATAVGPAVAGITYAFFGPGWCFTINGVSYLAVIIALFLMKLNSQPQRTTGASALEELKESLRYVAAHPIIRAIIGLIVATSLFGVSFITLVPAWAVKILHGNAATNGWLQSARGVGALICALAIASLGRFKYKGRLLALGSVGFPALLLVLAFVKWLPLTLVLLIGIGMAIILIFNLSNSLVQIQVPDSLRGRVMGIYSLMFFGFMPVGSLLIGISAEHFGEPTAVVINSLILLGVALMMWIFQPGVRKLE